MVSPSALAVLRLMTNSNVVGCSTGRSAGFAPLRILSTYVGSAAVQIGDVRPVRHEPTDLRILTQRIHYGEAVLGGETYQASGVRVRERTRQNEEAIGPALGCRLECALELLGSVDLQSVELHAQRVRQGCQLFPVRSGRPQYGEAREARQRLAEKL